MWPKPCADAPAQGLENALPRFGAPVPWNGRPCVQQPGRRSTEHLDQIGVGERMQKADADLPALFVSLFRGPRNQGVVEARPQLPDIEPVQTDLKLPWLERRDADAQRAGQGPGRARPDLRPSTASRVPQHERSGKSRCSAIPPSGRRPHRHTTFRTSANGLI